MILAFDKPFGVLSQFTSDGSPHRPLGVFELPKNVYAVGRLDADSEGLLLLSDEKELNARLLAPAKKHPRTYFAQVERSPTEKAIARLECGLEIKGGHTLPARARVLDAEPDVGPRDPPIRVRQAIPTAWLELVLVEGKNRQVRRMTAAVGFPTLRLVRVAIGELSLFELRARGLSPGCAIELDDKDAAKLFARVSGSQNP